jgi:hypothetical protein
MTSISQAFNFLQYPIGVLTMDDPLNPNFNSSDLEPEESEESEEPKALPSPITVWHP